MAKITISDIQAGFMSQNAINEAFNTIEAEFQNKVLYRNNTSGEANQMENDIDMNNNDLLNVGTLSADVVEVGGVDIQDSVTAAATSASNAATSASNAATSASNAAASFDSFDDRFLGSKSSDPTLDNDGNALLTGALYWNSSSNKLKVYNGTGWVDTSPFEVDGNNNLGLGIAPATAKINIYSATNGNPFINMIADGVQGGFRVQGYGTAGMVNSFTRFGGTYASPTATSSNTTVGTMNFSAYGGTTTSIVTSILGWTETYTADNDISGFLAFQTRPTGLGAANTERMRIHASGAVSIGNTTNSGNVSLNVSGCVNGGYTTASSITTGINFGNFGNVIAKTSGSSQTLTAAAPPAGTICVLQIVKSNSTDTVITFGTGFISAGTLSTGTDSTKRFNVLFASNGTSLVEVCRNGPI